MPNPKLIEITLTKTIPVLDFNKPSAALNQLIISLAKAGWNLDFKEVNFKNKPTKNNIQLGDN